MTGANDNTPVSPVRFAAYCALWVFSSIAGPSLFLALVAWALLS